MDVTLSPFQLKAVLVPRFAFDAGVIEARSDAEVAIEWGLGAEATPSHQTDGTLHATLLLKMHGLVAGVDGARHPLLVVHTRGRFEYALRDQPLDDARERFFHMLFRNGAAALYGNLRPLVRHMTVASGFGELVLPMVDILTTFADTPYSAEEWVFRT